MAVKTERESAAYMPDCTHTGTNCNISDAFQCLAHHCLRVWTLSDTFCSLGAILTGCCYWSHQWLIWVYGCIDPRTMNVFLWITSPNADLRMVVCFQNPGYSERMYQHPKRYLFSGSFSASLLLYHSWGKATSADRCKTIVKESLYFNGHFPGRPGVVPYQNVSFLDFTGAKDDRVVVTTGAVSPAKLQSKCHHQQTNTQFFTGQMPFLSPNQQRQSTVIKE